MFALALSIDHNFKAMYDLGVLYSRSRNKKAAISCYECLDSFSPKTIDEKRIQIKPWRQKIKYYKAQLKTDEVNKKSYINKAINLCKLVSKSEVATKLEKESATEKLNRLEEKRVALVLVKTMKDAISS